MNLEARLIRLKDDLDKKALRDPRTVKEYAIRNKWERVSNILKKDIIGMVMIPNMW